MDQTKVLKQDTLNIESLSESYSKVEYDKNTEVFRNITDIPEIKLMNHLNVDRSKIHRYLKCLKAGEKYWDRYLKNKIGTIKNPADDKEFLKLIFKYNQTLIDMLNDEQMAILNIICKNDKITKIIDLLKFGTYSNYREKVKMIKSFEFTDFELIKLLVDFTTINKEVYIEKYALEGRCEDANYLIMGILALLNNTINIIRCIKMSYHKYEIIGYKDSKAIKKRVPIKNIIGLDEINAYIGSRSNFVKLNLFYYLLILLENGCIQEFPIDEIEYLEEKDINWLFEAAFNYLPEEYDLNNELAKALLDSEYETVVNSHLQTIDSCGSFLINSDIFFNRKVLLPKSGVIILPNNDELVESIYLKEKQKDDSNFLVIIVRYKDGVEKINAISLDMDTPLISRLYLKSADVKLILQKKEGVCIPHSFLYVMDFFGITSLENTILEEQLKQSNIVDNYSVISPQYWTYRTKNYTTNGDTVSLRGVIVKREFEIEIAPFLRKIQGEAGYEAQEYAKKIGLNLEKGYTIVKPHKRLYNKIAKANLKG